MAATAPLFWQRLAWASLTLLIVALLVRPEVLAWTIGGSGKWRRKLHDALSSLAGLNLLPWCTAYLVTWLLGIPFCYAVAWAFPEARTIGLVDLTRVVCLVVLIDYVTVWTLGGLAFTRDITLSILLSRFMPLPVAIAVASTLKLTLMLSDLAGNGIILLAGRWLVGREEPAVAPAYDLIAGSD